MSAQPHKITAIARVDLDSDETRIAPDSATFLKGFTWQMNKNAGGEGYNAGAATPREGCLLQTGNLVLPSGNNYCCGYHEAKDTNEGYVFVWNSNNNHLIYRINGADGVCEKIYGGKYLRFSLDPRHFIGETRCVLKVVKFYNKATDLIEIRKFLCFVDAEEQPRMVSVEDSLLTNSFDYAGSNHYFDPLVTGQPAIDAILEKYINLAIDTPMDCIGVTAQKRLESEKSKQNLMLFKGWQWRLKYIDVYNRESEHGVISDRYFTVIGSNCLAASSSMPRCVRLKFKAGNPLVNKIQIEFRTCANNSDLSVDSDWYLYDTVDKYDNAGAHQYWNRPILDPYKTKLDAMNAANIAVPGTFTTDQIAAALAPLTKYNSGDNTFEYTFCGDKQCSLIPVAETVRTDNNIPRTAHAVFPLNEGIGLANNKRQFEPVNEDMLKQITVQAIPPAGECDDLILRKIVVYAMISSPAVSSAGTTGTVGYVRYASDVNPTTPQTFTLNGCPTPVPYQSYMIWGSVTNDGTYGSFACGQFFPPGQDGFVAYLAGTNYTAISKQVRVNASTFAECAIGIMNFTIDFDTVECDDFEGVDLQKFEFLVPAGEYVVRLAHHRAKLTEDYQATSTRVKGRMPFTSLANVSGASYGYGQTDVVTSYAKEMIADVSAGDYINHTDLFIIQDVPPLGHAGTAPIHYGDEQYLKEDEVGGVPIALMPIVNGPTISSTTADILRFTSVYTDHNGFAYTLKDISSSNPTIRIDRCDGEAGTDHEFYYIPNYPDPYAKTLCMPGTIAMTLSAAFLYAGTDKFPEANHRVIKGRVLLCGDSEIGVGGAPVVPYSLRPAITNGDGEWTVIAHGRDGTTYRPLTDTLIISQNICQYSKCDDPCAFKFTHIVVAYIACQTGARLTTVADIRLNVRGINKSGPQNGGRYQTGVVFHANGRHDFVQTGENFFVDIPSMLSTHKFAHSTIHFSIDPSFRAPAWAEWMTFVISPNLSWDDFFMWSADRIAFVDAAGFESASLPVKIRIYYESMIEYLKQNSLNDNAVWNFITTGNAGTTVVGDLIEFYRNGDGTWFSKSNLTPIRYDKEGRYIEIDYDESLKDLKDGTLFKVIRPKTCITTEVFKELCPTIPIVAGIPQVLSGDLKYQDSFFLTRQFPVPLYTPDPDNGGQFIKTVSVRTSTYFYEHHSPSDIWGNHCWTRGRVFVKNPFERELYLDQQIALSKPLLNKSNFNGLSYFELADTKSFDNQEWGGIMAVVADGSTLMVICEHATFLVGFSDTNLRLDAVGNVYAGSALGRFGEPQRKIDQNNGCQILDINTIRRRKGVVVFVDRANGDLVFHLFSQSGDVAVNGFKSWLTQKIASQNANNKNPSRTYEQYFVAGIDPKTNEYYLTSFAMPNGTGPTTIDGNYPVSDAQYLNRFDAINIGVNETAIIDIPTMSMKGFAHFTPEYYGMMSNFHADRNMLVMRRAKAWSLHPGTGAVPVLNYFGVQCKKVLEFIANISPTKVKMFLYIQVYNSNHKLVASNVVTEAGQVSRILAPFWDRVGGYYTAAFLCDVNTPADPNIPDETGANALHDGNPLYGRWIRVRLQSDDADDAHYSELSGIHTYVVASDIAGE